MTGGGNIEQQKKVWRKEGRMKKKSEKRKEKKRKGKKRSQERKGLCGWLLSDVEFPTKVKFVGKSFSKRRIFFPKLELCLFIY